MAHTCAPLTMSGENCMEENETTVAGSQNDQVQKTDAKIQTHSHKAVEENQPERIHDDRVFRFRTGLR